MSVLKDVADQLWDTASHPFPTKKPHDPVAAAVAPNKKVKLSELTGKYSDWDSAIATAIILAESRGKVNATHVNSNGSTDRGLMQINSIHSQYDAKRLVEDPEYNVMAGHEIWKAAGGSFSPWTTYKTGAYKIFMHHDATVTIDPRAGTVWENTPAGDVRTGIDAIGDVVGALTDASTWLRLGKGTLGGVLIVLGVGGATFIIANRIPSPAKAVVKAIK